MNIAGVFYFPWGVSETPRAKKPGGGGGWVYGFPARLLPPSLMPLINIQALDMACPAWSIPAPGGVGGGGGSNSGSGGGGGGSMYD